MATLTADNPRWIRSTVSAFLPQVAGALNVNASATWKESEFLRLTSSGELKQCTSGAASGVAADAITHYALFTETAALVSTTTKVAPVSENDIWEMNEKSTTVTRAKIGLHYDLDVSSNVDTVNSGSSSHAVFEVVAPTWTERPYQDDDADTLARVLVRVLATAVHAAPAS